MTSSTTSYPSPSTGSGKGCAVAAAADRHSSSRTSGMVVTRAVGTGSVDLDLLRLRALDPVAGQELHDVRRGAGTVRVSHLEDGVAVLVQLLGLELDHLVAGDPEER